MLPWQHQHFCLIAVFTLFHIKGGMKVQKVQNSERKREEDQEGRRMKTKEDSGQQEQYKIKIEMK